MKKNKKSIKFKQHIKNLFTKNLAIKIVSFVFAMLLWGYVLTAQNPARTKNISNVNIIYEGEAELLARSLVVSTSDADLQRTISLQVDTELTKYADLSAANITATANMKSILSPGTYTIPVTVTTTEGTIRQTSINPMTVKVKIDELVTKNVPVVSQITGSLDENHWMGEPVLAKNEIAITGPAEYVNTVTKAICDINVSGRTESFDEAVELVLVQKDGSVVSKSLLNGTIPAVGVNVEILSKKTISIDVVSALDGLSELPTNYEVTKTEAVPAQITVVGSKEAISKLTSITLPPINVAGAKESIEKTVGITLPEGISAIEGTDINVYVTVAEKQEQINYPSKSIEIEGLDPALRATIMPNSTAVTIIGRRTLMNGFDASNFRLYVDLTDLAAGVHTCPIIVEFTESEYAELTATLANTTVNVTIKEN